MQGKFKEVSGGARQPELVRAQYEAYWSEVRGCAVWALAQKPPTLAQALRMIQGDLALARPPKPRSLRFRPLAAVMAGKPLPPLAGADIYPLMARWMTADVIAQFCDERTQRIVELGSGWGANLFQLRCGGAPRDAEFVALEYTEAGREVTQLLAAMDPAMKLSIHSFDYYHPDFSPLSSAMPTVAFSNHSIEQITKLGGTFFDSLLAVPGLQHVVHIEPVGWQLRGGAEDLLSRMLPPTLSWRLDFRRRARRHGYNTDLVPLLHSLERNNRIVIDLVLPDHIGANPLNPGTVIVWHPRGP